MIIVILYPNGIIMKTYNENENNKGEGNGKTFGQNNIISGNNIRNRVQINGETIEEGQIGDDVAKLNNHNMNHDHRVKEKGNRDRVNSHNDHSKTIEEGTIGDKQSSKQPKETIVTTTEEPSLWQKTKNWFG
ncbi:5'-AMP-activated serine/threonine-protein kinase catalytic subunit alpha-like isoform X2 [Lucilia sericata]|uniref:5'-AMP-activated serine/threonine-protein kinase catalytic subunit alpha-like isoform X2 n=1 Tax=Lucilia sericata TaxID=13632 RepID=UPI0018A84473|nr:5'-AMP-activated serine/threonine-protein kinase catalytic subunit alpha-like isoform X2 [Lucilia sericata]